MSIASVGIVGGCYITACSAPETATTSNEPVGEAEQAVCNCGSGQTVCWTSGFPSVCYCADLDNNVNNCGTCGHVCSFPHAGAFCLLGVCEMLGCSTGFGNCDGNNTNGCETSVTTTSNCGSCGHACTNPHGTTTCTSGQCSPSCNTGFDDCDSNPSNGCETNTQTDPNHCGSCGNACSVANGTAGCTGGACTVAACNTGHANCDGNVANGCEVNTNSDPNNCGACGHVCPTGQCVNGACSCTAGNEHTQCPGLTEPGCCSGVCTELFSPCHCGSCVDVVTEYDYENPAADSGLPLHRCCGSNGSANKVGQVGGCSPGTTDLMFCP